ncbi:TPA: hypothetical protein ACH3X1_016002 [Trebouxia sp. C0004]
MDAEQTFSPGHAINTQQTKYEAKRTKKVKKRKHENRGSSRRNMAASTEYKSRQDLDEGDADGTKPYNEYKRVVELLIHLQKDQT